MECIFLVSFFIFYQLMVVLEVDGFNLAVKPWNHVIIRNTSIESNDFFGYSFAIQPPSPNNAVRFLIGSPKFPSMKQVPSDSLDFFRIASPGKIHTCDVNITSSTSYCSSATKGVYDDPYHPNVDLSKIDSLGLSMAKQPNTNHVTVCAPLQLRNCSSNYFLQGNCHLSENFGNTWMRKNFAPEQSCPIQHLDLLFLIDGSGSVNKEDSRNFDRVKTWVKNVSSKFDIKNFAKVGVIQYSHYFADLPLHEQDYLTKEIPLGQFDNHQDFDARVDSIVYHSFTTFTAAAIRFATLELLNSSRVQDKSTKKLILLLTDGMTLDHEHLESAANDARSHDINIIAVGVADYSPDELLTITGDRKKVYGLSNFTQLDEIVGALQRSIESSLEGDSLNNSTNDLQQGETGMDAHFTRNGLYENRIIFVLCISSMLRLLQTNGKEFSRSFVSGHRKV